MKNRGISLVELLVAIVVATIILGAVASMFIGSNRAFRGNRDVSEMSEDVRNAITTLEFLFSRWGAGVPCPGNTTDQNNVCNINPNLIPPCNNQYPPQDPMCMDIAGSSVTFYANLYGIGFVRAVSGNNATVISCRLNTGANQNCYYVWHNARIKPGYDNNGRPVVVSLGGSLNQPDCMTGMNTVSIPANLGNNVNLGAGDYITRVPHRITIRMDGDWLVMDRVDMAGNCTDNENAVRIGRVQNFSVQAQGRSVRVDATFLSADGRQYQITRYYGR
ncbi:MAG: prepilin-type N-terminal cleavage/methylation domain-containing protein [Aquificaceae bacterium]|jgi:type II secretory pathway pseudopilin PulG|uniref:PilW family protein n=1 Tax=Hydrogenobacter sp. Uz 6-8 TaxID=3384828 RepID=UPI0030B4C1DD